jgi:glutamine synthetase
VFIGSQLSAVLDELENSGNIKIEKGDNMYMKLGIDKIPEIILDNTDRNRTSPFAFTGNKFEFRAVGGNANPGLPMTVLNTIMAKQLNDFKDDVDALISNGKEKRLAIIEVLRKNITDSKAVRFEGDGYSDEWVQEAEKRGLPNIKNTPEALDAFLTEKSKEVFGCYNVLSERELDARNEILWENYVMKVQIESRVMGDLALNHIIPTSVKYQMKLIDAAKGLKEIGVDNSSTVNVISKITEHIDGVRNGVLEMIEERKRINKIEESREQAVEYCHNIKHKFFDQIRYHVDKLELFVDDEDWPLVKFREMLFVH